MKKVFIYIAALCSVCMSCQKEAPDAQDGPMFFTAEIQQPDDPDRNDGKATFTDQTINFEYGDKIRVCDAARTTKKGATFQKDGTFKVDSGLAESDTYYGIYRYQATPAAGNTDVATANFDAPNTSDYEIKMSSYVYPYQQAVLNGVDPNSTPMFGKAGSDKKFKFIQVTSLLKFDLQMEGVTKVTLKSNDESVKISGFIALNVAETSGDGWLDKVEVKTNNNHYDFVTLIPPVGETTFPKGTYYIATRPDRNCTSGLTITFYGADDAVLKTATNSNKVQLKRGTIRYIGNFTTGQE